jgi:hypothetical protein
MLGVKGILAQFFGINFWRSLSSHFWQIVIKNPQYIGGGIDLLNLAIACQFKNLKNRPDFSRNGSHIATF